MKDNEKAKSCPLCGGEFEAGHTSDWGWNKPPIWIEGEAELTLLGLKIKGKRRLHIDALRCTKCGFIAQMATRHWTPGKK